MNNCLIPDDEAEARETSPKILQSSGLTAIDKCRGKALEAKLGLQKQEVGMLFLGIDMPVLDGMALLKTLIKPPLFIFTTAYREYAFIAGDKTGQMDPVTKGNRSKQKADLEFKNRLCQKWLFLLANIFNYLKNQQFTTGL